MWTRRNVCDFYVALVWKGLCKRCCVICLSLWTESQTHSACCIAKNSGGKQRKACVFSSGGHSYNDVKLPETLVLYDVQLIHLFPITSIIAWTKQTAFEIEELDSFWWHLLSRDSKLLLISRTTLTSHRSQSLNWAGDCDFFVFFFYSSPQSSRHKVGNIWQTQFDCCVHVNALLSLG